MKVRPSSCSSQKNGRKECRFGFPIPPVPNTCILKPLPNDTDKSELKTHKHNYNRIKEVLTDKKIDLNDMTFEEYLNVCRMKEDSYIMALRSSIVMYLEQVVLGTQSDILFARFFAGFCVFMSL
jgi:hypothetical protein